MHRALLHISTLLSFALLFGCATGKSSKRSVPPEKKAVRTGQAHVRGGLEDAFEASEKRDVYTVRGRFNEPRCDAPDFEVFAHGKWTRAYLDGKNDLTQKLESLEEKARESNSLETLELRGRFSGKRRAETGLKYPVFWVESVKSF